MPLWTTLSPESRSTVRRLEGCCAQSSEAAINSTPVLLLCDAHVASHNLNCFPNLDPWRVAHSMFSATQGRSIVSLWFVEGVSQDVRYGARNTGPQAQRTGKERLQMAKYVGCEVRPHARDPPEPPGIRKLLSRDAAPTDVALQAMRGPQTSQRFDERTQTVIRCVRITEQCNRSKGPSICTHGTHDLPPPAKKRTRLRGRPRNKVASRQ